MKQENANTSESMVSIKQILGEAFAEFCVEAQEANKPAHKPVNEGIDLLPRPRLTTPFKEIWEELGMPRLDQWINQHQKGGYEDEDGRKHRQVLIKQIFFSMEIFVHLFEWVIHHTHAIEEISLPQNPTCLASDPDFNKGWRQFRRLLIDELEPFSSEYPGRDQFDIIAVGCILPARIESLVREDHNLCEISSTLIEFTALILNNHAKDKIRELAENAEWIRVWWGVDQQQLREEMRWKQEVITIKEDFPISQPPPHLSSEVVKKADEQTNRCYTRPAMY